MKFAIVLIILFQCLFVSAQENVNNQGIRLFRYGDPLSEKPAVVMPDGKRLDVSAFTADFNEEFFASKGIDALIKWLEANSKKCKVVPDNARIASCVARPSKIVAIGLNYAKHVKETGGTIPKEPVIFMKATTSLCGPNDNVIIPKNSMKTDWEVELAIVIGKRATNISEGSAASYIAGYAVINDYSERAFQSEGTGQWTKGKSADTFAPLGPYLVKASDVGDPQNLKLWLKVNGEMLQQSNTSDMIYKVHFLVSYVSQFMTLLPGDVIATGTPEGVGMGLKPQRFLKPGDVVELGIEKLGEQRQVAVAYREK